MSYEVTIGMEIHAELATKTKMFCACSNSPFESAPNANICPVCLALPGSLPVMNKQAVEWTVDLGADVGATMAEFTKWDRKNYFYPDLPKGYQISQYDLPLLRGGAIEFKGSDGELVRINLTRIHLEEDTGKLVHVEIKFNESEFSDKKRTDLPDYFRNKNYSLVDYNRAGVPLLELVTEPELHSAEDAKRFCQTYQTILQRRGIARADMEKGELRCEANVSVRQQAGGNRQQLGTKVEVKNLNSFRAVERAIQYEIKRQTELLESGETVLQETRGWADQTQQTYVQRRKESAHDYRYFPEPDLPPVTPPALWDLSAKERTAEPYPHEVAAELQHEFELSAETAQLLAENAQALAVWSELTEELPEPSAKDKERLKIAATTYANVDTARELTPPQLLELAGLIQAGTISKTQIREVVAAVIEKRLDPAEAVRSLGLEQTTDIGAIESIIDSVLATNVDAVAKYRSGKTEVYGFLVGAVMRQAKGKANPTIVNQLLKQKLKS